MIPVKIRCRKAWEAAVNLIDGDREMEGKGKLMYSEFKDPHTRLKYDAFNSLVFFVLEFTESRLRWTKIEMTHFEICLIFIFF